LGSSSKPHTKTVCLLSHHPQPPRTAARSPAGRANHFIIMGNQAAAKMIMEDNQTLGAKAKNGQFWQCVKEATHMRDKPSGNTKACPDQPKDTVLVEEDRQLVKPLVPGTAPDRLWVRVVSSRDANVRGWSAVHDIKTGQRKLQPVSEAEKHVLDIAFLLKSAQKTAAQWGPLLFCNALHGMQAAVSSPEPSQAPRCACCAATVEPESAIMTCPSGCAYSLCFPCAELRVFKLNQAGQFAQELTKSGVRALHTLCTVQGAGHEYRGALTGVALSANAAPGPQGCVHCRQSLQNETPVVRCCNTTSVCFPCVNAMIERQRQLNAGLATGRQLAKDLAALQIACAGSHVQWGESVGDRVQQPASSVRACTDR
jgi:hypothetical protein